MFGHGRPFRHSISAARLALGEIEVKSGVLTRGRAQLQTVERDASQKGFVLLARKAASHLREATEHAIMDQSGAGPKFPVAAKLYL